MLAYPLCLHQCSCHAVNGKGHFTSRPFFNIADEKTSHRIGVNLPAAAIANTGNTRYQRIDRIGRGRTAARLRHDTVIISVSGYSICGSGCPVNDSVGIKPLIARWRIGRERISVLCYYRGGWNWFYRNK